MCVGAKISTNERILEKIHEKAHNFGTKVRIFHSSHMFSAEKVSSLTRLFHLRGVPSGRDTYRGAAKSDEEARRKVTKRRDGMTSGGNEACFAHTQTGLQPSVSDVVAAPFEGV